MLWQLFYNLYDRYSLRISWCVYVAIGAHQKLLEDVVTQLQANICRYIEIQVAVIAFSLYDSRVEVIREQITVFKLIYIIVI